MAIRTSTPSQLAGRSTAAGTSRYRNRFEHELAPDFYRPLADGSVASSIGLGTYLGECDEAEDALYADAIVHALARGINLIDTAINYRCQRSERATGVALRAATAAHVVARDEVIVCTKGGFVPLESTPPATREEYHAYLEREYYGPGIMTPVDVVGGGHCIAPRFLANQVQRSLANLGVATIDVYYIHNPEQQLTAVEPERLREMLRDAFAMLEERVAMGEIAAYGCATWNGFRIAPRTRGHLNLRDIVGAAVEAGGTGHHFRAVQLPVNLAMSEAVRLPTQTVGKGRKCSLVEAAAELGVSVVASATLMQAQLTSGLPSTLGDTFPKLTTDAQRAIGFVRALPITSALVGMKTKTHVDENIGAGR